MHCCDQCLWGGSARVSQPRQPARMTRDGPVLSAFGQKSRTKPPCILGGLAALSWCRIQRRPATMAEPPHPELLPDSEEVLRLARLRLTQVIEKVGDPAAIKAAEDLCAEAAAAVAAHKASGNLGRQAMSASRRWPILRPWLSRRRRIEMARTVMMRPLMTPPRASTRYWLALHGAL